MKRVWTVLSIVALANLLALVGFVGWLVQADRLDKDRFAKIRATLTTTITAEQAELAAKAAEDAKAKQEAAAAAKMALPPITASQAIEEENLKLNMAVQMNLRRQRELEDLRASLFRLQASLEQREQDLTKARLDFEQSKKRYAEIEGAEQFQKALATLEGQKPKDAKSILQALLVSGESEQVVSYLAKMDEGVRIKVIAEFAKDSSEVAADLLERLRTRGMDSDSRLSSLSTGAASLPETGSNGSSDTSNAPIADTASAGR